MPYLEENSYLYNTMSWVSLRICPWNKNRMSLAKGHMMDLKIGQYKWVLAYLNIWISNWLHLHYRSWCKSTQRNNIWVLGSQEKKIRWNIFMSQATTFFCILLIKLATNIKELSAELFTKSPSTCRTVGKH